MSTENQTATKRIITIYSTKGAKKAKIETEANTWAELKPLIAKEGYDLNSLHATENVNKTDLVNEAAVLPATEFTVFLRPKQTKSGAGRADGLAYKDIRDMIKGDIESYPDAGKEHYNQGKNYTTKSTDELRDLANTFIAPAGDAKAEEKKPAEVKKVAEELSSEKIEETIVVELTNADHIENIKHGLACIIENASSEDVKERAKELLEDFIPGLEAEVANDSEANTTKIEATNVADVVKSVADSKESAEEEGRRIAREKAEAEEAEKIAKEKEEEAARKKAEKEENDRLAAEAKSLGL